MIFNMISGGGASVLIDGQKPTSEIDLITSGALHKNTSMPSDGFFASVCSHNGSIYASFNGRIYKFVEGAWTLIASGGVLDYFSGGSYSEELISFDNKLHLMGSSYAVTDTYTTYPYAKKYYYSTDNGVTWTAGPDLPIDFVGGQAVVYNNELHILGGLTTKAHYKLSGNAWVSVSTLPLASIIDRNNGVAVLNNYIYMFMWTGNTGDGRLYRWNGSTWSNQGVLSITGLSSALLCGNYRHAMVNFNNNLYIIIKSGVYSGIDNGDDAGFYVLRYTGSGANFEKAYRLPFRARDNTQLVVHNSNLNVFGNTRTSNDAWNIYARDWWSIVGYIQE